MRYELKSTVFCYLSQFFYLQVIFIVENKWFGRVFRSPFPPTLFPVRQISYPAGRSNFEIFRRIPCSFNLNHFCYGQLVSSDCYRICTATNKCRSNIKMEIHMASRPYPAVAMAQSNGIKLYHETLGTVKCVWLINKELSVGQVVQPSVESCVCVGTGHLVYSQYRA